MNQGCLKCLLPNNFLNIEIDGDGICHYCHTFKEQQYYGVDKLKEVIKEALNLNQSEKYDCVVGFSGGRDSTYLLWYVVKILKLRALAVFSDDLFIPDITYKNIENTCKSLDIELRAVKHNYLKNCIKHHLKAWIKRPVPETLMFINVGERIGYETLVEKEAIKEGVHLIFGGRTSMQREAKYKADLMKIKNRGGRLSWFLGYVKQIILNPSLALNFKCLRTQYSEFMVSHWKAKLIKKYSLTVIHPFFEYIVWLEKDIENVLFNKLNWTIPEGSKNSARFGCEVDTLRQYLYLRILGYNDAYVDLSYLIRDGQITKDEAKEKLKNTIVFSEDYIRYILTKSGVNAEKFLKRLNYKYPIKENIKSQINTDNL